MIGRMGPRDKTTVAPRPGLTEKRSGVNEKRRLVAENVMSHILANFKEHPNYGQTIKATYLQIT